MNDIVVWVNDVLTAVLTSVDSLDPVLRTALAGLAMLLETSLLVGLIVPGDTVVLLAGTGVTSPLQYVALVLTVIAGSLAGESIGFALGHFFGLGIRHSKVGRRIGEKNWIRAENYLNRRGGIGVFASRFLPLLHSLVPVSVGFGEMRYRTFMRWTIPACTIWAVTYVTVGTLAAGSFREIARTLSWAGVGFVAVIALFIGGTIIVKKLIERSENKHMAAPEPATPVAPTDVEN
jgi:membrane-associated protein